MAVEFRTPTGAYSPGQDGHHGRQRMGPHHRAATRTGVWRLRYGGNALAGAATAVGDTVAVVP